MQSIRIWQTPNIYFANKIANRTEPKMEIFDMAKSRLIYAGTGGMFAPSQIRNNWTSKRRNTIGMQPRIGIQEWNIGHLYINHVCLYYMGIRQLDNRKASYILIRLTDY